MHRDLKPGQRHDHPRRPRQGARLRPRQARSRRHRIPNLDRAHRRRAAPILTTEGQVFGTVAYMSPEQTRGGKVDARSDVFSLGVVMYQMLIGERPFHGETAVDLISSILRDRPASVTDVRPDLPPDLARIIRRCLEKEPRDRYQTSRDVYNELKELRSEARRLLFRFPKTSSLARLLRPHPRRQRWKAWPVWPASPRWSAACVRSLRRHLGRAFSQRGHSVLAGVDLRASGHPLAGRAPPRQLLRRSEPGLLRGGDDRRADVGPRQHQRPARDLTRLGDAVQGENARRHRRSRRSSTSTPSSKGR